MPPWPFDVMTGALVAIFLLSLIFYLRRGKIARDNPVLRRFIRRASQAYLWASGIGIFLAIMRYLGVDYIDMPFWLYLDWLLLIGITGYFVYERSERYPLALWEFRHATEQRRYRPEARRRAEPQTPRPNRPRGKRRR